MGKKKLLLTCSGGETSMFMVVWCLRNLQDSYDMTVVFANTGQESDETIEFIHRCEVYFNIPITWIEANVFHGQRKSTGHKITDYAKAVRVDDWKWNQHTPFEEVIKKYNIPNHSRLHCTRELKINPIKSYAKSIWGKEKYYLALGIRVDEIDRMNAKKEELRLIYPLIQKELQPMTKKHINFWWSQQPFRLNLKGYQGNCVTCYKKSRKKLYQIAKETPEYFKFFDLMERRYGNPNGVIPVKNEKLSNKDYKNTFFRGFTTAKDIISESLTFDGYVIDDSEETESCEIFSSCGD